MVASQSVTHVSPEDYLKSEAISPIKHEYIRGEICAMAGGSDAHDAISLNLLTLLKNHLRGSGCRPYTGNMKVHIEPADVYYYRSRLNYQLSIARLIFSTCLGASISPNSRIAS